MNVQNLIDIIDPKLDNTTQIMQKVLTLLITAVILYMIIQHNRDSMNPRSTNPTVENSSNKGDNKDNGEMPELDGNFLERTISKVIINALKTEEGRLFMENLFTPMDQPIAGSRQGYKLNNNNLVKSMFNIQTFGEGKGGAVSCGHMVTVRYKLSNLNNIELLAKTDTYPLGNQKNIPGLDAIIVGMKVGQMRQAVISSKFVSDSTGNKSPNYKLTVELLDVVPKIFVGDEVKIFDDEIAYQFPLLCGQNVAFDAKVTKLSNGKIIYDSTASGKKLETTIGNIVYPVIVSHALHNKIAVGSRTVIAPGRLFKSFATEHSTFFPDKVLPANEYFMLELMNFRTDTEITYSPARSLNNTFKNQ